MEKLITGGEQDPLLPHLCAAIGRADQIDFAVAFIMATGLRLLLPDLHTALNTNGHRGTLPARVRVLTSDYLDVTDPEALRLLMLLQQQGAEVRVFETAGSGFHLKAYLFTHLHPARPAQGDGGVQAPVGPLRGTAFIGSSNLSKQALTHGLEWNYRIDYPSDHGFLQARAGFEALFAHVQTVPLTDAWIAAYEARRQQRQGPNRAAVRAVIDAEADERDTPPSPSPVQTQALAALHASRQAGYRRGLVVLATGLGKTWLAAFDAERCAAQRVLFVAHREEILNQAADTFLRIRPQCRIGFYLGQTRDTEVEVLCASIQTLSRAEHLQRFAPQHFDYVVVDEFHHAAAHSYRRLLSHFQPRFLLGLTATPDRSDQSDILSLCDDNLVFDCSLREGINAGLLAPFHYYGIHDHTVDYREIPWRNGRFDPDQISHKLATLARARHALQQWRDRAQSRTLAFCVSIRHAEFMAKYFASQNISAAPVYAGSELSRGEALNQLDDGRLQVIFSVDLFNEGVDLPTIDTVMMLRPTESKILFLQQLGRGLRKAAGKAHLVVLDFIGNHHSFLHKPQALLGIGASYQQLAEFARECEEGKLQLPAGCFINYELQLIEFLKSLDSADLAQAYQALKASLGRRPTLAEFYRAGANLSQMRSQYSSWFELLEIQATQATEAAEADLSAEEITVARTHCHFLKAVEAPNKLSGAQLLLLEALQELDGWASPPTVAALAQRAWQVLQHRRALLTEIPPALQALASGDDDAWRQHCLSGPVADWIVGTGKKVAFFRLSAEHFEPTFPVAPAHLELFADLVQELIDYRLAVLAAQRSATMTADGASQGSSVRPAGAAKRIGLPYFPDLKIACGHFRNGNAEAVTYRRVGSGHGQLDPARHFIAQASGDSMNGGKHPIRDGDTLLLELITPSRAGSITGETVAIERQDSAGDNQYLLRTVAKEPDGHYRLKASNPDYDDLIATDEMRPLARLKAILDPLELAVGEFFMREQIPPLFGVEFNPGNWNSGHVVLNEQNVHVLLVTINKQGMAEEQRFHDYWVDEKTFHWQSQKKTSPSSKNGKEIIEHEKRGIGLHLFVREHKLLAGKGAPFQYHGRVRYLGHSGSKPMSVVFEVKG